MRLVPPARSLQALGAFKRVLFLQNPCAPVQTTCIWTRAGSSTRAAALEARYGWIVTDRPDAPKSFPSDSYVCSGAYSLGSGRSVFVGNVQLKGVGRTAHAPAKRRPIGTDGRLRMERAVRELHGATILRNLMSLDELPLLFALLLPREAGNAHDCVLLGRAGSPLRVAHLNFLRGASYMHDYYGRFARWRKLVNALDGKPGYEISAEQIEGLFDFILERALTALCEVRLFGLTFCNWFDNADAFSRTFDCEDVEMHFGRPLKPAGVPKMAVRPGEEPGVYLQRSEFASLRAVNSDVFTCSLQFLQNAWLSIVHLADGVTYDPKVLARRYSWAVLKRAYVRAMTGALARFTACDEEAPEVAAAAQALCRTLPLVPQAEAAPVSPKALLLGLRDALAGQPAHSAEARLGARLAPRSRWTPATLDAFIAALDGKKLLAARKGYIDRAATIAAGPAAARPAAYRTLFAEIDASGAALALP